MADLTKFTTYDIEALIYTLHEAMAFVTRGHSRRHDYYIEYEKSVISRTVKMLHDYRRPARRPYMDYGKLLEMVGDILLFVLERADHPHSDGVPYYRFGAMEQEYQRSQQRIKDLEAEIADLQAENERLALQVTVQPQSATVQVPAEQITIRSEISQAILGLMARTGVGRSWRIIDQVLALGKATNPGSVQNAITSLTSDGLIEDFVWEGTAPGWRPPAGGRARRLIVLTGKGAAWAKIAYQQPPVPTELDTAFIRRHDSVAHAVGILEAADHLRAVGYEIEADPAPLLAGDERWGRRSEPDLLAIHDDARYPVEVQREVHKRRNKQWAKALRISERLLLIVFSEQHRRRQEQILQDAKLPGGEIYLASLEAMETGDWQWSKVM